MMNYARKGNIINYLPGMFQVENSINEARIYEFKNGIIGEGSVVYLIERELRIVDNFSLTYAENLAKKLNKNLKIVHIYNKFDSAIKQKFYDDELEILKEDMALYDLDFQIIEKAAFIHFINSISPACIVIDFNPIKTYMDFEKIKYKIIEIDSHNIIPARYISDKQEYSAFQFRRKVYDKIYGFFTEFNNPYKSHSKAYEILDNFIQNNLDFYASQKNNPNIDILSHLSPYINWGFISSQRVALEVYKSNSSNQNKEAFLEELIVRKELADNFCLYNRNYKSIRGTALWASRSLLKHKNDFRPIIYSLKVLENAETHDIIWNTAQKELVEKGKIHGYVRMYWAKMLLQWTETPSEAIETAIYLNDKYAFDAPSANGYVGILWAIAGLHDRPFREESISGKIRRMSYDSLYKKLKNGIYIKNFEK